jgi:hypothetical protein
MEDAGPAAAGPAFARPETLRPEPDMFRLCTAALASRMA